MLQDAVTSILNEAWLGETDVLLLREGRHLRPWEKLGAHPSTRGGVAGTTFAVWAPHARQVSVVGDFNRWDPSRHLMHPRSECGAWELFVPGVSPGALYKLAVWGADGAQVLKTDPYALRTAPGPSHACMVMDLPEPLARPTGLRASGNALTGPISIYEVHAGSWRRPDGHFPDWDQLAHLLVPYVLDLGFTHIELMPVHEHPLLASWGYQPTGLYAPTARYGAPEALRNFVATAHAAGLQVLLDWVPAHFPANGDGLACFDGSAQFELVDLRKDIHRARTAPVYNYGRCEVRNFLLGNALFWVEQYGFDGLRVDAVASMLYGEDHHENDQAIDFLRDVNRVLENEAPGAVTLAEESTAFSGVTAPLWSGGLGFRYKWNLGWMHDTLAYFGLDPIERSIQYDRISFAMTYAYSEHFVLPLSHDEVTHGKGSLYQKMWGEPWQKLANLRALYALMFAHPGRKLLFMGCEFAQIREWNHDAELDWHLLDNPAHAGVQQLVRDLNRLYGSRPALHALDNEPEGFRWIDVQDLGHSVFSFVRYGHTITQQMVVICNMVPVVRHGYRLGVPQGGVWREVLNTDAAMYGGSGMGNGQGLPAQSVPGCGYDHSVVLNLPPLGVLWLERGPAA